MQVRQEPAGSDICPASVSVNTAVAMMVAGKRVAIYSARDYSLFIDGTPAHLGSGTPPLGRETVVSQDGSTYTVRWPSGELVTVAVSNTHLDLRLDLPRSRRGDYRGLLGT